MMKSSSARATARRIPRRPRVDAAIAMARTTAACILLATAALSCASRGGERHPPRVAQSRRVPISYEVKVAADASELYVEATFGPGEGQRLVVDDSATRFVADVAI